MPKPAASFIFLKRFVKYAVVYLLMIVFIVPVFFNYYDLSRKLARDSIELKLKEGVRTVEYQFNRANEIVQILQQEESFNKLVLVKGKPSSEYYLEFWKLRNKLQHWALTVDLVSDAYLIFRDNGMFLSNHLCSDNYQSVYPSTFRYIGRTAQEWRDAVFSGTERYGFFPSEPVYSAYNSVTSYDGISLVVNYASFPNLPPSCAFVFVLDSQKMLDALVQKDQQSQLSLSVESTSGGSIFQYQPAQADPDEKMVEIAYQSEGGWLKTRIGVPESYFNQLSRTMVLFTLLYMVAGMSLLFLLAVVISLVEARRMQRLVDSASNYSDLAYNRADDYKYVSRVLQSLGIANRTYAEKVNELNGAIRASRLENLLLGGNSQTRLDAQADCFSGLFSRFCIISVMLQPTREDDFVTGRFSGRILRFEQLFRERVSDSAEEVMIAPDQLAIVLTLPREGGSPDQLKRKLRELLWEFSKLNGEDTLLYLGVSDVWSGAENAAVAYRQAKNALNMNSSRETGGVYFTTRVPAAKLVFDANVQMKLYDVVMSGDSTALFRLFEQSESVILNSEIDRDKKAQIFYTFLYALNSAFQEVQSELEMPEDYRWPQPPHYTDQTEMITLFEELKAFGFQLCEVVNQHKQHKSARRKDRVLQYIGDELGNSELTVASISSALMISERYISAIVKEKTGKTLPKYLEELRIQKAEKLLLTTELSNMQIFTACGFGSEKTFYRCFSKLHSMSPNVWRDAHRDKK